ncbi:STAS domain-containing protein [Streptomyces sp. HK10]|uniref:STAS domain-containing protein n=1 Tax=Streptomyces sp. HK10 TaxID=3373255 RepID=UPI003748A9F2
MPTAEPATPPDTVNRAELSRYASITWRTDGPHTLVTVTGSLEVHEGPPLRKRLWTLVEQESGDLILDMRGVDFIDSTGLGALVGTVKKVRPQPDRSVRIVPSDHVRKVLRLTSLTKVFPIHETPDEALTAAASAPADGPPPPAEVVLLGESEFTATGPYTSVHLRMREGAAAVNAVRGRGGRVGPVLVCHDHGLVQVLLAPGAAEILHGLPAVVALTENSAECGSPHRRPPTWAVPRHGQGAADRTDADALRAALTGPAPATGRAA